AGDGTPPAKSRTAGKYLLTTPRRARVPLELSCGRGVAARPTSGIPSSLRRPARQTRASSQFAAAAVMPSECARRHLRSWQVDSPVVSHADTTPVNRALRPATLRPACTLKRGRANGETSLERCQPPVTRRAPT